MFVGRKNGFVRPVTAGYERADATDAVHADPSCAGVSRQASEKCRSVTGRYTVVAPTSVPTAPARAGRDRAIGHLLVVLAAR